MNNIKYIQIDLDTDLHKEFKTSAAKNSQSIKDALIELIKYYILTTNTPLKSKKNES